MGWTGIIATHFKNGCIDRKAECDAYFEEGLNKGHYKILKSTMVSTVYYAAVKNLTEFRGKIVNGERVYEPVEDGTVFGVVFLTRVDKYWFYYKDMTEDMGPGDAKCPASILDLLSETTDEYALEWRRRCRDNIAAYKNQNALHNLPIGTIIKFNLNGKEYRVEKKAPNLQFKRVWWLVLDTQTYILSRHIPKDYVIIE